MISNSQFETIEFAKVFAKTLNGGEAIGLIGDLGAGKTVFVQGIAEELGVKEKITSPTFVILKEYNILRPKVHPQGVHDKVKKFVHVDAYRAENIEDIKSVGIEDFFDRDDVIAVVEWAEKIKEILPKNTIYINFKHLDENKREIKIK